jgi:hypothetical protein
VAGLFSLGLKPRRLCCHSAQVELSICHPIDAGGAQQHFWPWRCLGAEGAPLTYPKFVAARRAVCHGGPQYTDTKRHAALSEICSELNRLDVQTVQTVQTVKAQDDFASWNLLSLEPAPRCRSSHVFKRWVGRGLLPVSFHALISHPASEPAPMPTSLTACHRPASSNSCGPNLAL